MNFKGAKKEHTELRFNFRFGQSTTFRSLMPRSPAPVDIMLLAVKNHLYPKKTGGPVELN